MNVALASQSLWMPAVCGMWPLTIAVYVPLLEPALGMHCDPAAVGLHLFSSVWKVLFWNAESTKTIIMCGVAQDAAVREELSRTFSAGERGKRIRLKGLFVLRYLTADITQDCSCVWENLIPIIIGSHMAQHTVQLERDHTRQSLMSGCGRLTQPDVSHGLIVVLWPLRR